MSTTEGSEGFCFFFFKGGRDECVCASVGGDGDFTLHSLTLLSDHTRSTSRHFSGPVTALSNVCQEADSGIIMSPIEHSLAGIIIVAVPRINSILLSVVKLSSGNFISGISGCHSVDYHESKRG